MQLNLLDRLSDWNPQLFREIKGRLKVRNVAIAVGTSLLGQVVLFLFWLGQLPGENTYLDDQYCRLRATYRAHQEQYRQLQGQFLRYSGSKHYDPEGLFSMAFFISLMMIYASLFQLMLLMKTQKRSLWATATVTALNVLPLIILVVLRLDTYKNATLWLFSTLPWIGIEHATTTTMFMALLSEWAVLVLLNLQLTRQLRRAGESASKTLFASRPALPS